MSEYYFNTLYSYFCILLNIYYFSLYTIITKHFALVYISTLSIYNCNIKNKAKNVQTYLSNHITCRVDRHCNLKRLPFIVTWHYFFSLSADCWLVTRLNYKTIIQTVQFSRMWRWFWKYKQIRFMEILQTPLIIDTSCVDRNER